MNVNRVFTKMQKRMWKLDTKTFIERSVITHGDKYDYSLVDYKNSRTPIDIICKKCEKTFQQVPAEHIAGKGHWGCGKAFPLTQQTFIEKARNVHGDKYDYSSTVFILSHKKVKIICLIHGEFEQQATAHLMGNGCPKCGFEVGSNMKRKTTDDFIILSRKVHGEKYDYSMVDYKCRSEKVIITCRNCNNTFEQTPGNHYAGKGCENCNKSHGETKINQYLQQRNITVEKQQRFETCKQILVLPFDFYVSDYNLLIEFDGKQHFKVIDCWETESDNLAKRIERDVIKDNWCINNGKFLLRISYKDIDSIEEIITEALEHIKILREESAITGDKTNPRGCILATSFYDTICSVRNKGIRDTSHYMIIA